jgi:hypothetical protein
MQKLQRYTSSPGFVPDYIAESLLQVDFGLLRNSGIRFVAFDADSTLVHFRKKTLPLKTKQFLAQRRPLFDDWCIASNRIFDDLQPLTESIDAHLFRATLLRRKPQRRFFGRIIRFFDAKPEEVAMIGDKLVADIWGANRAGMVTVWVEKIGNDSIWDRTLRTRQFEKLLVQKYLPD